MPRVLIRFKKATVLRQTLSFDRCSSFQESFSSVSRSRFEVRKVIWDLRALVTSLIPDLFTLPTSCKRSSISIQNSGKSEEEKSLKISSKFISARGIVRVIYFCPNSLEVRRTSCYSALISKWHSGFNPFFPPWKDLAILFPISCSIPPCSRSSLYSVHFGNEYS